MSNQHPSKTKEIERTPDSVFIGNLSFFCTHSQLRELLSPFGEVKSIKICKTKQKEPLHYGFGRFTTVDAAQRAIKELNGTRFMGRKLRLCSGETPTVASPSTIDEGVQVLVSFVAYQMQTPVNEEILTRLFSSYGEVLDCVVKTFVTHSLANSQEKQGGYGFVAFNSKEVVQKLITEGTITFPFVVEGSNQEVQIHCDCKLSKATATRLGMTLPTTDKPYSNKTFHASHHVAQNNSNYIGSNKPQNQTRPSRSATTSPDDVSILTASSLGEDDQLHQCQHKSTNQVNPARTVVNAAKQLPPRPQHNQMNNNKNTHFQTTKTYQPSTNNVTNGQSPVSYLMQPQQLNYAAMNNIPTAQCSPPPMYFVSGTSLPTQTIYSPVSYPPNVYATHSPMFAFQPQPQLQTQLQPQGYPTMMNTMMPNVPVSPPVHQSLPPMFSVDQHASSLCFPSSSPAASFSFPNSSATSASTSIAHSNGSNSPSNQTPPLSSSPVQSMHLYGQSNHSQSSTNQQAPSTQNANYMYPNMYPYYYMAPPVPVVTTTTN